MCRVCKGFPPNKDDYDELVTRARILKDSGFTSLEARVEQARELDEHRLLTGASWGEPSSSAARDRFISSNSDPNKGLLLFVLCCWLNAQAPFQRVWSTYLTETARWIENPDSVPIPRGEFKLTKPHLKKTLGTAQQYGSLGRWFVETINRVVSDYGPSSGNLYRLMARVMDELMSPAPSNRSGIQSLSQGRPALLGHYKRVWMLFMSLRRDQSIVKCLFSRALKAVPGGAVALEQWYNAEYFSPLESQLPVDSRIQRLWPEVFRQRGGSLRDVAEQASRLAKEHNLAPSTFDAVFFGY